MAGDRLAFQRYLQAKRSQWVREAFGKEQTVGQYIQGRGTEGLAAEFRSDNTFWSENICGFLASSSREDTTSAIATIEGFWDPELGVVASIVLAALELACASRRTENLAGPIAVFGAIGLLLIILAIFGE